MFDKDKTQPSYDIGKEPPCPKQIGPYPIQSFYKRGGMSLLYLGNDPLTDRLLIIKVLAPKFADNKTLSTRFLKEADIIRRTAHPNIIKVLGEGVWNNSPYIAMEFIRGISLRQIILKNNLPPKKALEILLQIAYAVCHLHAHGIIHRDLKPENILLSDQGAIKLIDFGISELQNDEALLPHKGIIGTPIYMSPEQKENSNNISYLSDIYALGVIAYELILQKLCLGKMKLTLLPTTLRPIVAKAIKKNPQERYRDIVDFIYDLSKCLSDMRPGAEGISSTDMAAIMQETEEMLFPKEAPPWKQMEIGLAHQAGKTPSGLYADFFRLADDRFCICMAQPKQSNLKAIMLSTTFRGMLKMVMKQQKEAFSIEQLFDILNNSVRAESYMQQFAFSVLLLNCRDDSLLFASAGEQELLRVEGSNKRETALKAENPLLGEPFSSLSIAKNPWHPHDKLILCNFKILTAHKDKVQNATLLSAQICADQISEIGKSIGKSTGTICIQRFF